MVLLQRVSQLAQPQSTLRVALNAAIPRVASAPSLLALNVAASSSSPSIPSSPFVTTSSACSSGATTPIPPTYTPMRSAAGATLWSWPTPATLAKAPQQLVAPPSLPFHPPTPRLSLLSSSAQPSASYHSRAASDGSSMILGSSVGVGSSSSSSSTVRLRAQPAASNSSQSVSTVHASTAASYHTSAHRQQQLHASSSTSDLASCVNPYFHAYYVLESDDADEDHSSREFGQDTFDVDGEAMATRHQQKKPTRVFEIEYREEVTDASHFDASFAATRSIESSSSFRSFAAPAAATSASAATAAPSSFHPLSSSTSSSETVDPLASLSSLEYDASTKLCIARGSVWNQPHGEAEECLCPLAGVEH